MSERWLGVDFSGNHLMWRTGCKTSNVWIADVRRDAGKLRLESVQRVQELEGRQPPFERLVRRLSLGDFVAAGIDAPFSVPEEYVARVGGHRALLERVAGRVAAGRPFIDGREMVTLIAGAEPLTQPKPLRDADASWVGRVNIRSPMWTGARPGAPMTAACLTLLHRAARPMWPWARADDRGVLAEAFPAGQLHTWNLPYQRYDGASEAARATRSTSVTALEKRLRLGGWRATLVDSADALDAVLCAFGAMAVASAKRPTSATTAAEGGIVVHP